MNKTQTKAILLEGLLEPAVDFGQLVKLKLSLFVVFSSLMAYVIVAQGVMIKWYDLLLLGVGGFLVTGASNAINEVLEKDYDSQMSRTKDRPVASGRMSSNTALLLAGIMAIVGFITLGTFNLLTTFISAIALVSYAFVYTPLKRFSPFAVLVGAIPGALPMMIGAVAFEGTISMVAFVLFVIQFLWQFPHFWAIAWLGSEDYKKAGFQIIPYTDGKPDVSILNQAFIFSLMLVVVSSGLGFFGFLTQFGAFMCVLPALYLMWKSYTFKVSPSTESAKSLLYASLVYLPAFLMAFYFFK